MESVSASALPRVRSVSDTAACAAAVAAARKGLTGRKITVTLPGGPLELEWREADDHILMTGPSELEYEGTLDPGLMKMEPVT